MVLILIKIFSYYLSSLLESDVVFFLAVGNTVVPTFLIVYVKVSSYVAYISLPVQPQEMILLDSSKLKNTFEAL